MQIGLPGQEGLSLLTEALDRIAEFADSHDGTSEVLLLGVTAICGPGTGAIW